MSPLWGLAATREPTTNTTRKRNGTVWSNTWAVG